MHHTRVGRSRLASLLNSLVCILRLTVSVHAQSTDDARQAVLLYELTRRLRSADIDGAVGLFADDAVITVLRLTGAAPRVFVGQEQVREWVGSAVEQQPDGDIAMALAGVG